MPLKTPNVLAATFEWFSRAVPKPTEKNLAVQCGVHFEEVAELVCEIQTSDPVLLMFVRDAHESLESLANYLKKADTNLTFSDRVATLDAICDGLVTGTGIGYMLKMDPVGGLAEVNRSNWSKFVGGLPQFNDHGKIMKGEDYTKPNLDPFV